MGLDMYLEADYFLSSFNPKQNLMRQALSEVFGNKNFEIETLTGEVAYWRKCNQIHNWFVTNVQDGVDECQRSWVSCEQLEVLRDTCLTVLEDHDKAEELLPPQGGFFFGNTDLDDYYYFGDLKNTVEQLNKILDNKKDWEGFDFYYRASW